MIKELSIKRKKPKNLRIEDVNLFEHEIEAKYFVLCCIYENEILVP